MRDSGHKENSSGSHSEFLSALMELTPVECSVLELTGKGNSAKEIADKLGMSIHTVHSHWKNVRKKLGLRGYGALKDWWRDNCPEWEK